MKPDLKTLFIIESHTKLKWFSGQVSRYFPAATCVATVGLLFNLPKSTSREFGNIEQWVAENPRELGHVATAIQAADQVVLATDADDGGEMIASQCASLCSDSQSIYRMWVHALTEREFDRGIQRIEPFVHRSDYAFAQRYFDYLTLQVASKGDDLLPVGSVISPLLRSMAQAQSPVQFMSGWCGDWHIVGDVDNDCKVPSIVSLGELPVSKAPPTDSYLNHAGLIRAAYLDHALEPSQTAEIAQELYEEGLVTYTRTGNTTASGDRLSDVAVCAAGLGLRLDYQSSTFSRDFPHEAILPTEKAAGYLEVCELPLEDKKMQVLQTILTRAIGQLYRRTYPTVRHEAVVNGVVFEREQCSASGRPVDPQTGIPLAIPLNPRHTSVNIRQMSRQYYLATQAEGAKLGAPGRYAVAAKRAASLTQPDWSLSALGTRALHLCMQRAPGLLEPQSRENIKLILADSKVALSDRLASALRTAGLEPPLELKSSRLGRESLSNSPGLRAGRA